MMNIEMVELEVEVEFEVVENLYSVSYLYGSEFPFERVLDSKELAFLEELAGNLEEVEILSVRPL